MHVISRLNHYPSWYEFWRFDKVVKERCPAISYIKIMLYKYDVWALTDI
jgi:hypothetical protein